MVNQHNLVWSWRLQYKAMLMTVDDWLVSLHQCGPTLESASNYIIIIILDGFISDCMRIYCTSHDDIQPRRTSSVNIIMTRAVYSHTTLNAIQYYIIIQLTWGVGGCQVVQQFVYHSSNWDVKWRGISTVLYEGDPEPPLTPWVLALTAMKLKLGVSGLCRACRNKRKRIHDLRMHMRKNLKHGAAFHVFNFLLWSQ